MLHSFDFQGDAIACWRRLNMSLCSATCVHVSFIIRLEAKYWIHFTVFLAAFTCLALTPPKVNLFGWYLEHSEYIVGGLALADFWHAPHSSNSWRARRNIVFLSCHLWATHYFTDLPSAQFHEIWTQHFDRCHDENLSELDFEKFTVKGRF